MSIVIVGAGLAGATAATELREKGYEGEIVLAGSETHLPYERPPLSKGFLLGEQEFDEALVHGQDWYDDEKVDLRLGTRATRIDLRRKVVFTEPDPTTRRNRRDASTAAGVGLEQGLHRRVDRPTDPRVSD